MNYRNLVLPACFVAAAILSSNASPKRPAIVGVAHIGLKTDDLAAERKFYGRTWDTRSRSLSTSLPAD